MRVVLQHRGDDAVVFDVTDSITAYDDEGNTSRSDVLLSTTIDEVVLRYIDRAGEDVRRHIPYETDLYIGIVAELRTIDRVVGRDVEVVHVIGYFVLFPWLGVPDVVVILRGEGDDLTEGLSFLSSLICPRT